MAGSAHIPDVKAAPPSASRASPPPQPTRPYASASLLAGSRPATPSPAWPLLLAVALLGGCRGSTCEELARVYASVGRKAQPCLDHSPLPAIDPEHCEQHRAACDAEDLEQLDDQVECYQRLDTCQADQKEAFLEDITRCDDRAPSNACEAAIF
jgi:hypothetical protein